MSVIRIGDHAEHSARVLRTRKALGIDTIDDWYRLREAQRHAERMASIAFLMPVVDSCYRAVRRDAA